MLRNSVPSTATPCARYPDNRSLFDGLRNVETAAISCLQSKSRGTIWAYGKMRGLQEMDLEEVIDDATVIFLEKIETGAYEFQGGTPVTYCVEVAKRLVLKRGEKRKFSTVEIENLPLSDGDEIGRFYEEKEREDHLHSFLGQLGEKCQLVIRLRYFQQIRDAEVIEKNLAPYSTVGSLKVKRSECLSKLTSLIGDRKHLFFG